MQVGLGETGLKNKDLKSFTQKWKEGRKYLLLEKAKEWSLGSSYMERAAREHKSEHKSEGSENREKNQSHQEDQRRTSNSRGRHSHTLSP